MLELNPDGNFRFRTVVILVARQNGKTLLMQVLSLWRMYVDGAALIIGTAQNLDVAEEAWEQTVEMASDNADLAAEIKHVDRTNGKKALRLTTGERYKVAASSRRGGRGLSGDLALLDELREHRTWAAWSAVSKTTTARDRAQIVGMSNAGDSGSVVLAHLRGRALAAIEADNRQVSLGLFEWSAPDDAAIDDRKAWAMANPSLGYTISEDTIASFLESDPEDEFRTESLCQWVDQAGIPTLSPEDWAACEELDSQLVGTPTIGADINPRRTRASIGVAGRSDIEGREWHVEVIDNRGGTDWLFDMLVAYATAHDGTVCLDPATGTAPLIPKLINAGIDVETASGREYVQACGELHDAVTAGELAHIGQELLEEALLDAGTKSAGEAWKWTHRGTDGDITPLVAITIALHFAMKAAGDDYDVLDSIL